MEDENGEDERRYRAPALEKGLDILELLATAAEPMTVSTIVRELGRSHGELFRMIQVLEFRGYIVQDAQGEGYALTDRLFSLGMHQPVTLTLVEAALPEMRQLAARSGQSCHLALHTLGDMVVVARMESADQLGFSVRIGYRRPLPQTASGTVLYAFQPEDVRARWEQLLDPVLSADELAAFRTTADEVRARGHHAVQSAFVSGVTDLSAPILRGGTAAAALTMPFLDRLHPVTTQAEAIELVKAAAERIAAQLIRADNRL